MNIDDNPRIATGLAIWMFVVFLAWTSFWCWNAVHVSSVAARQQTGQAMVVSLGRWNHGQTYVYTFHVENKSYAGNSLGESPYRAGQLVPVYFDPLNPKTSSLQAFSWSVVPDGLPMGFGIGAMFFAFLRWRRVQRGVQ